MGTTYELGDYLIEEVGEPRGIDEVVDFFKGVASELCWEVGDQLEVYREHSVYWKLVQLHTGELAGGMQVVLPNHGGFPIMTVWPEVDLLGREGVCDFALLALGSRHRAQHLHWRLTAEGWRYCHQHGIEHIYAEVAPKTLRGYRLVGLPFEQIGPERIHWGEPTVPCHTTLSALLDSIRSRAPKSVMHAEALKQALR